MKQDSRINITSGKQFEFTGYVKVDNINYLVQTEDLGSKICKVVSTIYLKGEIVSSRKSDYSHLLHLADFKKKLLALMENHHRNTIELFIAAKSGEKKSRADYFEQINTLLRRKNAKSALDVLRCAMELYPDDPFLLSHYGYLLAVVENNPSDGVRICTEAIEKLDKATPFGREFFYPVFFLNLGRAHLKAGNKRKAVASLRQGLEHDPENRDLKWEVRKLGERRRPPLSFLHRSNPINKYLGMLLYRGVR